MRWAKDRNRSRSRSVSLMASSPSRFNSPRRDVEGKRAHADSSLGRRRSRRAAQGCCAGAAAARADRRAWRRNRRRPLPDPQCGARGSACAVSMQIGTGRVSFRSRASSRPFSPGIITSSRTVELEPAHARARARGVRCRRHAEAMLGQVAPKQLADLLVVVDDEHVGRVVGNGAARVVVLTTSCCPRHAALISPHYGCRCAETNERLDAGSVGLSNHGKKKVPGVLARAGA